PPCGKAEHGLSRVFASPRLQGRPRTGALSAGQGLRFTLHLTGRIRSGSAAPLCRLDSLPLVADGSVGAWWLVQVLAFVVVGVRANQAEASPDLRRGCRDAERLGGLREGEHATLAKALVAILELVVASHTPNH